MSYSFYVPMAAPPARSLFLELGADVAFVEDVASDAATLPTGFWHLYREGISVRSVEVCHQEGALQARIMTGSCRQDYELALALVRAAARQTGAKIESEEGESFTHDGAAHGADWIAGHVAWGAKMTADLVREKGTVHMMAVFREFHFGARVLAELEAAGPAERFADRTFEAIRATQYIDEDHYYAATVMSIESKTGARFTITAWAPDVGYLFPDVEYLHVIDATHPVIIPRDALWKLPGVRARWADEVQVWVEPIPEDAWGQVSAAAKRYEIDPAKGGGGGGPSSPRGGGKKGFFSRIFG